MATVKKPTAAKPAPAVKADKPAKQAPTPKLEKAVKATATAKAEKLKSQIATEEITEAAVSGKGCFEIKRGADKRYMFNVRAGNTQIIANSQMYTTKASCENGIKSVGVNAPIAPTEDQTLRTFEKQKCPKFQIYLDKGGKYRFNLLAANGDNILSCTQGYTQKSSCKNGIASVIKNAAAPTVVLTEEK